MRRKFQLKTHDQSPFNHTVSQPDSLDHAHDSVRVSCRMTVGSPRGWPILASQEGGTGNQWCILADQAPSSGFLEPALLVIVEVQAAAVITQQCLGRNTLSLPKREMKVKNKKRKS